MNIFKSQLYSLNRICNLPKFSNWWIFACRKNFIWLSIETFKYSWFVHIWRPRAVSNSEYYPENWQLCIISSKNILSVFIGPSFGHGLHEQFHFLKGATWCLFIKMKSNTQVEIRIFAFHIVTILTVAIFRLLKFFVRIFEKNFRFLKFFRFKKKIFEKFLDFESEYQVPARFWLRKFLFAAWNRLRKFSSSLTN